MADDDPAPRRRHRRVVRPGTGAETTPERSDDDTDRGWDRPEEERSEEGSRDDWYQRERPPHW